MGRAERVVLALGALGEAGQAAALAQRADAVAPAGEDLVRIGLVADVPDQPVARRVEDVVQRDRQLDDAEPGAEMAAGDRDRVDRLGAQLVGDCAQLRLGQPAQILRRGDGIEERGVDGHGGRGPRGKGDDTRRFFAQDIGRGVAPVKTRAAPLDGARSRAAEPREAATTCRP